MSSRRDIESLILTYSALVDAGDFAGVGDLLAEATFVGRAPVSGRDAIVRSFEETLIVYDDGTPKTRHLITNVTVDVTGRAAVARSSFTALQAVPGFPLQPIATGHYDDRFVRRGGRWRFVERRVTVDLAGDLSHHLRAA